MDKGISYGIRRCWIFLGGIPAAVYLTDKVPKVRKGKTMPEPDCLEFFSTEDLIRKIKTATAETTPSERLAEMKRILALQLECLSELEQMSGQKKLVLIGLIRKLDANMKQEAMNERRKHMV
jgi:hypothetical protein